MVGIRHATQVTLAQSLDPTVEIDYGEWNADHVVTGVVDFGSYTHKFDVLVESTLNAGVTIETITLKDGDILGPSGGMTIIGGTGSGDDLILQPTTHAGRGTITINDELDMTGAYAFISLGGNPWRTTNLAFDEYNATTLAIRNSALTDWRDLHLRTLYAMTSVKTDLISENTGGAGIIVDKAITFEEDTTVYKDVKVDITNPSSLGNDTTTDYFASSYIADMYTRYVDAWGGAGSDYIDLSTADMFKFFIDDTEIARVNASGILTDIIDEITAATGVKIETVLFKDGDITGPSGGMTVTGGTASGDDLTLESTTHATKGDVIVGDDLDVQGNRIFFTDLMLSYAASRTLRIHNKAGGSYGHLILGDLYPYNKIRNYLSASGTGTFIDSKDANRPWTLRSSDGGTSVAKWGDIDALTIMLAGDITMLDQKMMQLGTYTDAQRPAAGTPGRMIFNTDDGMPNYDDGTNWRDINGNIT